MRYIAKIPQEYIDVDDIKWLKLEPQIHNNKIVGYYMLLYEDINLPNKWDNWYQSLEIAFDAGSDYGIKKEDWEIIADE